MFDRQAFRSRLIERDLRETEFAELFPEVAYHRVGDICEGAVIDSIRKFHVSHCAIFEEITGQSGDRRKTIFTKIAGFG